MAEEEAGAVSPETAEGAGAEARQLLESLKNASVGDLVAAAGGGAYCFACTDASDGGEVFSESPIKIEGDGERLKTGGIGLVCRKGFLSEGAVTPNQDKLFVLSADDLPSVYGIFDGHGDNGHEVAQLVCESLPKLLLRDERFGSFRTEEEQTSMLKDAFEKMQQLLVAVTESKTCDCSSSGSAATVVIHYKREGKLAMATIGEQLVQVLQPRTAEEGVDDSDYKGDVLTEEYHLLRKEEQERVRGKGAVIGERKEAWQSWNSETITTTKGQQVSVVHMRSLGTLLGQEAGVIYDPWIAFHSIGDRDKVIVMSLPGLFHFVPPKGIADFARDATTEKTGEICQELATCALNMWNCNHGGELVDDISFILAHI
eukprot:TRINITY_DN17568_c0_g1_i9.p1 TRINITY_DN17568_c0_g1~~TRINITY_DN17568_c0_g1_i9.p1  ORF type:complete len:372 (+),score=93.01 TRINITY_DN17568_c0_g1_i9:327-1442(+)